MVCSYYNKISITMSNKNMDHTSSNLPSNKKFGLFFAVIFVFSAIYFFCRSEQIISLVFCSLSFIFILLSYFKDNWLLPLNKLWMHLGILLGKIVSPIVLAILFFIMFTPIAIGMRIFRRDELRLKSLNTKSYWKIRDQVNLGVTSFKQQF